MKVDVIGYNLKNVSEEEIYALLGALFAKLRAEKENVGVSAMRLEDNCAVELRLAAALCKATGNSKLMEEFSDEKHSN